MLIVESNVVMSVKTTDFLSAEGTAVAGTSIEKLASAVEVTVREYF
jgi:hypothetical protein